MILKIQYEYKEKTKKIFPRPKPIVPCLWNNKFKSIKKKHNLLNNYIHCIHSCV
jgi:hypothetical protein